MTEKFIEYSGSQREGFRKFRVEGGQVEGQVYEVFQIPKSKA